MNSYQVDDIFRLKKPKGGFRVWRVVGCMYGATNQESVIELECLDVRNSAKIICVPVIMMEQIEWIDEVKQLD